MKMYEGFKGLEKNTTMFGKFTKYSLGNIGFAKSQCFFQYATIQNTQHLKCSKGTLSELVYFGATSSEQNQMLIKQNEYDDELRVGHDFCGDRSLLKAESDCTKWVDFSKMENDYNDKCLGQEKCDINLSSYMRTGDDIKGAPKYCTNKFTQIYIQT